MPNAFTLLGLPRVAALDEDTLQRAWLEASRSAHPDQPGGDVSRAAEINSAYETLAAPEKRLKHLLELHEVPWRTVPIDNETMALFGQVGQALQSVSSVVKKKEAATSALAKALLAADEMKAREQAEALGVLIEEKRAEFLSLLPGLDARLNAGDSEAATELQQLQARLAYLAKWQGQIREALLTLLA